MTIPWLCETCEWWDGPHTEKGQGTCAKPYEDDALMEPMSDDGYTTAGLLTMPDYGCVQWQDKEGK